MKITSHANPLIKDLLKLYKRSFRDASHLFILEGRREVARLDHSFNIKKVFTTDEMSYDAPTYRVSPAIFEKITIRSQKEGVLVVAEQKHHSIKSFFELMPHKPNILILDRLQKPGNVGAILRSAVAFGLDGVILSDCDLDLYNPNLLRSAISSIQNIPVLTTSATTIIPELNQRGVGIIASSLEKSQSLSKVQLDDAFALVLGSEDKGVSNHYLKACDQTVQISMNKEAVDSLNVSVAAACFCYEIHRRKRHSL